MIIKKIKSKIESKRGSKNVFWAAAVLSKDLIWRFFNFAEIRSANLLIKLRKPKGNITDNGKINLLSYRGELNFGDRLSELIVEVLSGRKCNIYCSSAHPAHKRSIPCLLAVGSLVESAINNDIIWGSGIRNGGVCVKDIKVFAVRGPLTRKRLISKGIRCPEIYGDPTILLPEILQVSLEKKYHIGVVKHFNDESVLGSISGKGIVQINVSDEPIEVIKKICQCENIISSSLHGIIVAESFGIPACWVFPKKAKWKVGNEEPALKFRDYYLSTGREPIPYEVEDGIDLSDALEIAHKNKKPLFNKEELLLSFPFLRAGIRSLDDLKKFGASV